MLSATRWKCRTRRQTHESCSVFKLLNPIHTLLSSTPPCDYSTTTRSETATIPMMSNSHFPQFRAHRLLFLSSSPHPISGFHPFSLYSCGSLSISRSRLSRTREHERANISKLRALGQKVEVLGINWDSCTAGRYNLLTCPKCKGGQSMERSLSFRISENEDFAMWRCFHAKCGWAGQTAVLRINGVDTFSKLNCPGQMTVESLGLVPLGEKLIAYFAERMISENILRRNAVMQIFGDQGAIAFTYRRNGVLVSCKYRSFDKKFWQEKCTEKILYGLDDIKETKEIIIVEGEIDKLSMEEAGFRNCVSVPDGAPQKVSAKELPSLGKDSAFQYLWNCKEYLDKASRIVLATDGDIPGQVLAEELARRLGRRRCWRVTWPKKDEFSCFKDANEVLKTLGSDALREVVDNAELWGV